MFVQSIRLFTRLTRPAGALGDASSSLGGRAAKAASGLVLALSIFSFVAILSLAPSAAQAAKVLTIDAAPIGATLSLAEIEKRIKVAGNKRGWRSKTIAPGHIEAMIHVRTHTATVDIKFDTAAYSIYYKDSTNLDYKDGKIHRAYNNWVTNLSKDIMMELNY